MKPVYIIAEAGVNHNGSLDLAYRLVDSAKSAGADAVKFQTFSAAKLVSQSAKKAAYQVENDPTSTSQYEMLKKLELGLEDFGHLSRYCAEVGIDFMTTCFDTSSLQYICDECNPSLLKVGSGDLTNLPLLIEHARTGRRIIISTGMATLGEIEDALSALAYGYINERGIPISYDQLRLEYYTKECLQVLNDKISILHCVTDYPANPSDINLGALDILARSFGLEVGYSDHTLGAEVSIAAVALGASVIEKHLTLDRTMDGPDHAASADPAEFKAMVSAIRNVELALIRSQKTPTKREKANLEVARKYIVASQKIEAGQEFALSNLEIKRTGFGRSPKYFWDLIGQPASKDYEPGDAI